MSQRDILDGVHIIVSKGSKYLCIYELFVFVDLLSIRKIPPDIIIQTNSSNSAIVAVILDNG